MIPPFGVEEEGVGEHVKRPDAQDKGHDIDDDEEQDHCTLPLII